jgi:two-component system response regulator PilR (NtrC family)
MTTAAATALTSATATATAVAPRPVPTVSRALPIPHGMIHAPGSPLESTLRLAAAAAKRDCPVFVRGESGSGKEMLAQYLHAGGPRARGPFVAVNCAALAPGLIESELFGHRKGAFTGAVADNPGRFRQADGGTLFLDEIGDMPLEVQTRLLRALQEKRVSPVGDAREYPVDFRLVCATHRDLRAAVASGRFREDLFYRLNVLEVPLPPLRDRPGDIRALMGHFLSALLPSGEAERAMDGFPSRLTALPYPGNIRELRNLAERYCVLREMGGGWPEAVTQMLPEAPVGGPIPGATGFALPGSAADPPDVSIAFRIRNSRVSDGEILHALDVCGHHRGRASGLLGISRRALQYRLAKMGRNNNASPAT